MHGIPCWICYSSCSKETTIFLYFILKMIFVFSSSSLRLHRIFSVYICETIQCTNTQDPPSLLYTQTDSNNKACYPRCLKANSRTIIIYNGEGRLWCFVCVFIYKCVLCKCVDKRWRISSIMFALLRWKFWFKSL